MFLTFEGISETLYVFLTEEIQKRQIKLFFKFLSTETFKKEQQNQLINADVDLWRIVYVCHSHLNIHSMKSTQ